MQTIHNARCELFPARRSNIGQRYATTSATGYGKQRAVARGRATAARGRGQAAGRFIATADSSSALQEVTDASLRRWLAARDEVEPPLLRSATGSTFVGRRLGGRRRHPGEFRNLTAVATRPAYADQNAHGRETDWVSRPERYGEAR